MSPHWTDVDRLQHELREARKSLRRKRAAEAWKRRQAEQLAERIATARVTFREDTEGCVIRVHRHCGAAIVAYQGRRGGELIRCEAGHAVLPGDWRLKWLRRPESSLLPAASIDDVLVTEVLHG